MIKLEGIKMKIILFCGKSASGKDEAVQYFKREFLFTELVPYTTRPMREGEVEGKEYKFVTITKFRKLVSLNKFLEFREYDTLVDGVPKKWFYGTPRILDYHKDYVAVVTPSAIEAFINAYGKDNVLVVYIQASEQTRRSRAMLRGSFCDIEWNRRVEADNKDFDDIADILESGLYGEIVTNEGSRETFINKLRFIGC